MSEGSPDSRPESRPESRPDPRPGQRFRHFKGGEYTVVGVGLDTVTEGRIVIYRADYPCAIPLFSRPLAEFLGALERDGKTHVRFASLD